ncbi:TPA: hypothetical protein L6A97_00525 [Pseudomonas aeruginosa]|nr:hypothetical protein [Pseudomonas aeruginosa]
MTGFQLAGRHRWAGRRAREGRAMRRALTALGIIAALGLTVVGLVEIFPTLRTLAAWQAGCH